MDDMHWNRIEQELKRQPPVDPVALSRVHAEIRRTAPGAIPLRHRVWGWFAEPRLSLSPLGALAAAAVLIIGAATVARRAGSVEGEGTVVSAPETPGVQAVQFVFVADSATQVALVGDFNDWDPAATPLRRSASGMWSVEVPLHPGRHVYAFVVDGRTWVPDAAAPRAPDNGFGIPNSIVFVGGSS